MPGANQASKRKYDLAGDRKTGIFQKDQKKHGRQAIVCYDHFNIGHKIVTLLGSYSSLPCQPFDHWEQGCRSCAVICPAYHTQRKIICFLPLQKTLSCLSQNSLSAGVFLPFCSIAARRFLCTTNCFMSLRTAPKVLVHGRQETPADISDNAPGSVSATEGNNIFLGVI